MSEEIIRFFREVREKYGQDMDVQPVIPFPKQEVDEYSTEAQVQIFLENARLRAAIHGLCTLLRRNPPAALDTKKMPELEAILISLCQTTIEKLQPARGGPGDE